MLRRLAVLLFFIPALALADVELPGEQHIGDDTDNNYMPSQPVNRDEYSANPSHFSLSEDITVTAITLADYNLQSAFGTPEIDIYIDGGPNSVYSGTAAATMTFPTSIALSAGIHSIAVVPQCIGYLFGFIPVYATCPNVEEADLGFSSLTLISSGTTSHKSFNHRYHLGDSTIGNDEYAGRVYPDDPDTDKLTLQFTLANDSQLEQVTFYNVRDVSNGCAEPNNVYLDNNNPPSKIGEINANGTLVITANVSLDANPHTLIIESGRCSGNGNSADYDDISWDDIILEFSGATVGAFNITAPLNPSVCAMPITITVEAEKQNGGTAANYNKTITLSTSSGHGVWGVGDGVGDFTDLGGGIASYEFVPGNGGDGGIVNFSLTNTHADNLTISVVENGDASTLSTTPVISFRENAFVIRENDILNTVPVAGRPHQFNIILLNRDTPTSDCGPNLLYDGNKDLKFSIQRTGNDPSGIPPTVNGTPLINDVTLDFTDGQAQAGFTLNTSDVGQYTLEVVDTSGFAKDENNDPRPIFGSSMSALTIRPFSFRFSGVLTNSGPNGPVIAAAGDPFSVTLDAVVWQSADDGNNDGIPDVSADLSDNAITPAFAATIPLSAVAPFTPTSGVLGSLNGGSINLTFSAGTATPANLRYDEVGEVTLLARLDDYLGTGVADTQSRSELIGRFTPKYFVFDITSLGCHAAGFTYSGQPLTAIEITAHEAGGGITESYEAGFAKDLSFSAIPAASGALTNNTGIVSQSSGGVATYTGLPTFTFTEKESPPEDVVLTVSDTDGVSGTAAPIRIVSGRLALQDVAGSELLPLVMPVTVQYFDSGWKTHTNNTSCTILTIGPTGDFSFASNAVGTSLSGLATDVDGQEGTWSLQLAAPGTTGYADVTANGIPAWLQDDWDNDGTADDNPQARASFGLYNGNEKQIYIRE